jgi:hypothetical protein
MTLDFFFPEDHLNRAAPEETHITALSANPYPDGRRLRVNIEMTPFQVRPHLEITLKDGSGEEVATVSVVEPMTWKIEFTMHIRGELLNPYALEARLFYPDGPAADPQTLAFDITPPPADPEAHPAH